jgi:methyl-accepting chemotaxis protein
LLPSELVSLVRNIPLNADTAIYLIHRDAVFAANRGPAAPARGAAATMSARLADTSSTADLGFSVEADADQRAALAPLRDLALRSTLIGVAVLLLAGFAAVWTARRIATPLKRVRESAHALALGQLDAGVDPRALGAIRELADLGGSFNAMAHGLRALVGGIGTTSNAIAATAKENLGTAQLLRTGTGESAHAAAQIVAALTRLGASAHNVLNDCVSLEASSRGGLEKIGALVGEVDETNVALLQLSDTIARSNEAGRALARHARDVAERARAVGVRAETAQASADRGGDAVRELVGDVRSVGNSLLATVERLEHLAASTAQAINTQVGVITDLAERSELLALNAGIEAARAGVHGRGFTVIAQELHRLATGSHEAGREVGTLVHAVITETQALVKTASSASDLARTAIAHAGTTGEEIERLVSEIGESTRAASEIAQIAANQAQETAAIEHATGEMRSMANATAGSAERVAEIARAVRDVIDIATSVAARVASTAREQTAALTIIEESAADIERTNVGVADAAERSFATSDALDRQIAALAHTAGAFGSASPLALVGTTPLPVALG